MPSIEELEAVAKCKVTRSKKYKEADGADIDDALLYACTRSYRAPELVLRRRARAAEDSVVVVVVVSGAHENLRHPATIPATVTACRKIAVEPSVEL